MSECKFENIFEKGVSWADKCTAYSENCGELQNFINFFDLFICKMNGSLLLMLPFAIILIYLIFKYICALVDEYIAASIEYMAAWLNMSEALAGVTLIALANGAGDVVTAIVASGSTDGVAFNVGALFGAGLFVCTFVMTFTIYGSTVKPIIVDRNTIYRDILFYIIATLFVISCGIYGKLTIPTSCIMLLIYIALVVTVYIQDKKGQK